MRPAGLRLLSLLYGEEWRTVKRQEIRIIKARRQLKVGRNWQTKIQQRYNGRTWNI
jgi:hypothetical protein